MEVEVRNFEDYPAAHSMDTEWYAIDEDGHIAQFDSGKFGAVPLSFREKFEDADSASILNLVVSHLPKDENGWFYLECDYKPTKEVILQNKDYDYLEKYLQEHKKFSSGRVWGSFIVVESEEVINELDAEGYIIFFDKEKTTFYIDNCAEDKFKLACKEGKISGFRLDIVDIIDELARILNFFIYEERNGWPYERVHVPEKPTHIKDIPEPIRSNLSTSLLKGAKFKDYHWLQPPRHVESIGGLEIYIDYEGKMIKLEGEPDAQGIDAEWAAIDKNGYVAIFLTEEIGAVPIQFLNKFDYTTMIFSSLGYHLDFPKNWIYLNRDNVKDDYNLIREKVIEKSESLESIMNNAKSFGDNNLARALIVVDSQKILKQIEPKGQIISFSPYNIAYVERCPLSKFEEAYRKGRVKGVISSYRNSVKGSDLPEFLGFFVYRATGRYYYTKTYSPPIPIKIENVSNSLKPRLSTLCFRNIEFKDHTRLEVAKHFKTQSLIYRTYAVDSEWNP